MKHAGALLVTIWIVALGVSGQQKPTQPCDFDHWPQTTNLTQEFRNSVKNFAIIRERVYYILHNDSVFVTGSGEHGVLGLGEEATSPVPATQPQEIVALRGQGIDVIQGNHDISLALGNDGVLWTWGRNANGQLGHGENVNNVTIYSPRKIELQNIKMVQVSLGWDYALALDSNGDVWSWGANTFGQLGLGHASDRDRPIPLEGPSDVSSIAVSGGIRTSAALDRKGRVWGWGSSVESKEPELIGKLKSPVVEITANAWNILMLTVEGDIFINYKNNATDLNKGDKARHFKHIYASNSDLLLVAQAKGKEDGSVFVYPSVSALYWIWDPPVPANTTLVSEVFVKADLINNPMQPPFMCRVM